VAIKNRRFWDYWKKEMYDEALQCAIEEEKEPKNRLQTLLFGPPEQLKQTAAVTGVSIGELIYDYIMIDPVVVRGLDFARSEDLSSLFSLSQFSSRIDTDRLTGDMAQLQGYVAEQMIAAELQAKGHDVEFPDTSNNPGWDLLVDGQPFQVKSLADPAGVREHLAAYPDIPVYVNEELTPYFEGHPNVYVSGISREEVLEATRTTMTHAEDLLDFEIPWIAAAVSSVYNAKRVWKDELSIQQAVFHIASDTSSKVLLGALGQKAGVIAGTMLFGPAGGIAGAMFGAYAGASQGARLSTGVKRLFSKKQEQDLIEALEKLVMKVDKQINRKLEIKQRKLERLASELEDTAANRSIWLEAQIRARKEWQYARNKQQELQALMESIRHSHGDPREALPRALSVIARTGVHPIHFQDELKRLQLASKEYAKKV